MTAAILKRVRSMALRAAASLLRMLVAVAVLAREAVAFLGAPLWRLLARLRLLAWLTAWVGGLGRWQVLGVLAAPLAIAEPLKMAGLYALAIGQFGWGVALQLAGHGLSIILVERILDAGHAQLMTFGSFARLHDWYSRVRTAALAWPPVVAARKLAKDCATSVLAFVHDLRLKLGSFGR